MKGDFSRIRFIPSRQYTAVLEQQGRVSLDADTNEQAAIDEHLRRTEIVDVIGASGAPEHDPGFGVTVSGSQLLIGAGRYYVQGLLCENRADGLSYTGQEHLLSLSATDATLLNELAQAGGSSSIQVFLQVWQRLVTALDDPCLREPALGQADTTARVQTVWRVLASLVPPPAPTQTIGKRPVTGLFRKTLLEARLDLNAELEKTRLGTVSLAGVSAADAAPSAATPAVDCCTSMYAATPTLSTGTMKVSTATAGSDCSCEPVPAAGYQGLENQLYRIEIQAGGTEANATFKWSRENGSVVSTITSFTGNTLVVESLGPDANLGFVANGWVELFDDADLFGETPNSPGLLYQVLSVDPTVPSITLTSPVIGINTGRNARVRRWDQTGPSLTAAGVPISVSTPVLLESGIEVIFRPGTYQAGDYWTVPARTASGVIDWPPCGGNGDLFQPPESTRIYNAPLACIHWDPKGQKALVQDCRRLFFPLTEINPGTAQALHVQAFNWTNDARITADVWVANGLTVTLDGTPTGPVTNGNFIVTLESIFDPFPANGVAGFGGRSINLQLPSTYIRTCVALDSTVTVNGPAISWTLPYLKASPLQMFTVNAINAGLLFGASLGQYARVRVRLIGSAISSGNGNGQLFLDGKCLGQTVTSADGRARVDLQVPSSNGEKFSDFESWFYLAPTLLIANLSVAFPALFAIAPNGNLVGVADHPVTGSEAGVNPFVTITANYHALADAQVTLALLDADGKPSQWASIDSPVTIHAGDIFTTAAIHVTGNPMINGDFTTVTITVQASIATAIGPVPALPVTFTLHGGAFTQIN